MRSICEERKEWKKMYKKSGSTTRYIKLRSKKGMEMVQVAILIAIAVGLGIIFKEKIGEFINQTFGNLMNSGF